jgi:hypothetical protein
VGFRCPAFAFKASVFANRRRESYSSQRALTGQDGAVSMRNGEFSGKNDVDRIHEKSYGNLKIKFVNLKGLILRMSKLSLGSRLVI